MSSTLRVVQWSVGNIGSASLRGIIEHPSFTLVGVHVHDHAKIGRDAGELCGLSSTGIIATAAMADVLAARPDCVVYMRQGCNYDEVCTLLSAGVNVVTTRGEFHHPAGMDPAIRARVEAACHSGGASIYSTGSSPGFATEALTLPLLSLQRRLDYVTIDEFADLSQRASPAMLFEVMGFGAPPGSLNRAILSHVHDSFAGSLAQIADAIGLRFDVTRVKGEAATATEDTAIAAGVLRAGTVAAQRITVTGLRKGRPIIRFRSHWYCSARINRAWPLRETGWHISVAGDTPLEVAISFPVPLERYAAVMPGLTAHRAVNAIAAVCAAAPGIRTTVDLPQVVATF